MKAKSQEWLKFLNVCDDTDFKYQCLGNEMHCTNTTKNFALDK